MRKISTDTFFSITAPGRCTLFPVAGAFLLVLTLAMPFYNLHYTMTARTIYTLEVLIERFSGGTAIPLSACASIIFNFLLGMYVLLAKNTAKAPLFAVIGIMLSVFAVTRLPVAPGSFGAGIYASLAGLVMVTSGLFAKSP